MAAAAIARCSAPSLAAASASASASPSSPRLHHRTAFFHATTSSSAPPRLISLRSSPAACVPRLLRRPFHCRRRLLTPSASGEGEVKGESTGATDEGSVEGKKNEELVNAEKLAGVLRDTTEQLKEQAEKAKAVLYVTTKETAAVIAATAQETAEKSKGSLSYIAENAPEPFKEVAETALKAHSPDTPKTFAKIHDFCLGIPYGALLVTSGLLWFIISGSTAAIRFGVILGGLLLALSISSLKSWKEGKSSSIHIKGQAAISFIIALREVRRFSEVKSLPSALVALISAAMFGFYCYVHLAGGNPPPKKAKAEPLGE